MRIKKTMVCSIVIISFLCVHSPLVSHAKYYAASQKVTQNAPQIKTTPPEPIATGKSESTGGGKKVLWGVLGGAALIGLVAAVVGGSGGSSSSSDRDDPEPETGSVQVEW